MPKTFKIPAFTLIEIVVAVSIFMLVLGVSMRSYLSLLDGQNQSNLNRIAISELKNILQVIETENHQKSILYPTDQNNNSLSLISDDLLEKVIFKFESNFLTQSYANRTTLQEDFSNTQKDNMHSQNLKFKTLQFIVTPNTNPYDIKTVDPKQHPKVQIIMQIQNPNNPDVTFDISTTLSNRKYQALTQ